MVSVLCAVCGSYGGLGATISAQQQPCATCLLTLRTFPAGSKALYVLPVFLGEVLRAWSGPCCTRGLFFAFCSAPSFVTAVLINVFMIELALDLSKFDIFASIAAHQRELHVSCRGTSCVPRGVFRQRCFLLGQGVARAVQHVVPAPGGSVPPQHRRVLGNEHVPQQGCSVAVMPLRAFREPPWRGRPPTSSSRCATCTWSTNAVRKAACLQRRHE